MRAAVGQHERSLPHNRRDRSPTLAGTQRVLRRREYCADVARVSKDHLRRHGRNADGKWCIAGSASKGKVLEWSKPQEQGLDHRRQQGVPRRCATRRHRRRTLCRARSVHGPPYSQDRKPSPRIQRHAARLRCSSNAGACRGWRPTGIEESSAPVRIRTYRRRPVAGDADDGGTHDGDDREAAKG
jgi:hypothetical protein